MFPTNRMQNFAMPPSQNYGWGGPQRMQNPIPTRQTIQPIPQQPQNNRMQIAQMLPQRQNIQPMNYGMRAM